MEFAADGEYEKVFASEMKLDVSPTALFDTLNERMASIIQSFNAEDADMKTKAEQLKELNEKLAGLTTEMAKLGSATDKEKDEQVKKLSADIKLISDQVKALSETDDDSATARERAAAKAREEQTQKDLKEANEKIAELQADGRRRSVAEKVSKLRVPAFRPMAEALYTYGLTHAAEKVKVYSKDKDGKEVAADKSLVDIADDIVANINGQAEKLFKAYAQTGNPTARQEGHDPQEGDDAGVAFDNKVKAYMAEKKEVSYTKASEAVATLEPDLFKRYSEQTATRAARHSN